MQSTMSEEILERAAMRANRLMWAIDLQVRRIRSSGARDFLERELDFEFLVVAAARLRRSAMLACRAPEAKRVVSRALSRFDDRLPGITKLRDTAEHIDEYSTDRGRDDSIARKDLEVRMFTNSGQTWTWLGESISVEDVWQAGDTLYRAIKAAKDNLTSGRTCD